MDPKSKANLTINDIAALAGVSKRTVSRVLNDSGSVNPQTKEKILALFAQYNYSPSKQARGLASSRSYLVGLIYDEPNAQVIHAVQKGLITTLSPLGYELVVHPMASQQANLVEHVQSLVSRSNLDGLIILPPISVDQALIEVLQTKQIPFVGLAVKPVGLDINSVVSDDYTAMQQVAALFAKHKLNRPAIICGDPNRRSSLERRDGLQSALASFGMRMQNDLIVSADYSYESGLKAAKQLLEKNDRPDGIFASNDQMAIATMHVAQDMGISVPEDLIIVGYDDEPIAARMRPSLTTLKRDNTAMAQAAAEKLLAQLNGQACNAPTHFEPTLIERQSTIK
jgi:LacI family transcriptional regulator